MSWEDKANHLISEMCFDAYRKANYLNGKRKSKKQVPYAPPYWANELVRILGMPDKRAAEIEAKGIFMRLEIIPESKND